MDNLQVPVLVDKPAMYRTSNNFLSFADLSNNHKTSNSTAIDTLEELDMINMTPFIDQSWREDVGRNRDYSDASSFTLDASPYNPVTPLGDMEPEQEEIFTDVVKEEIVKRKRNTGVKDEPSVKQATRALQYPPCYVCGGKASGDHYGVNSCEACKGFFRRYLLRKKGAYQCKNGGRCEVVHTKRGMCAGCRLNKCLELGMSKDKCKLGRYSAEKRTEKIRSVKELNDRITFQDDDLFVSSTPTPESVVDTDIISKTLAELSISSDTEESFSDDIIPVLIKAKNEMQVFGPKIDANNPEDIKKAIRAYHEEFQLKVKLYGELKPVPKEDFMKLYKTYGIDVDNRLEDLKKGISDINGEVFEMCNFAKHIPFFSKLSIKDQSNLLKAGSMEMYLVLTCRGYDPELNICLDRYRAYHVSEMDKFFSSEFVTECLKSALHCQRLKLNEAEQALVMALSLFFTDRCVLDNPRLVEKIQLSMSQVLKRYLEKTYSGMARTRFTSIIEYLTDARKATDMFNKEYEEICKDEVYTTEFPILFDFLPKE